MISPTKKYDSIIQLSESHLRFCEGRTAQASILIVDHEHVTRDAVSRLLTDNGYRVQTADSGPAALKQLRDSPPDLVLLTVSLPGQDGLDVLRAIRQQHSESRPPVVIVTAEMEPQQGVTAFREGANDVLARPFDDEILLARISLHLQHSRARAELQRSRERYALAAKGARIGLWDLDVVRQQIFLSSRWKELLGFAEDELDSTIPVWLDRMHPDDRDSFIEMISTPAAFDKGRFDCELRMRHRNDSYRWMLCSGVMQLDADGNAVRLAGSLADVTEGKVRDVLTGLPNRLLFEEQLSKVINLDPNRYGLNAVLFLDLDDFKRINDNHGHDAGDLLLCSVARKLEGCLRGSDVIARQKSEWSIARHGGDEFTILLHQLESRADAEQIAERIIGALAEPFLIGTREVLMGVSIGIGFGGEEVKTPADAIREADTAMYYAKTSGRSRYCVYDPEMQAARQQS
ncbi:MAG: diguanylate cyclase [Planctomycetaceae bacterium]